MTPSMTPGFVESVRALFFRDVRALGLFPCPPLMFFGAFPQGDVLFHFLPSSAVISKTSTVLSLFQVYRLSTLYHPFPPYTAPLFAPPLLNRCCCSWTAFTSFCRRSTVTASWTTSEGSSFYVLCKTENDDGRESRTTSRYLHFIFGRASSSPNSDRETGVIFFANWLSKIKNSDQRARRWDFFVHYLELASGLSVFFSVFSPVSASSPSLSALRTVDGQGQATPFADHQGRTYLIFILSFSKISSVRGARKRQILVIFVQNSAEFNVTKKFSVRLSFIRSRFRLRLWWL